jgi:hypothetical protein
VRIVGKAATEVTTADLRKIVGLIDMDSLDSETIKAHQGSAGIKEIYEMLKEQIEA